ncbi:unnamed protein product, partial [marine sediment metagenome]
ESTGKTVAYEMPPYRIVHEAVLQVKSEEHGENKIVEEFEKGYLLNGRLLRPARVSVSKSIKKEDND